MTGFIADRLIKQTKLMESEKACGGNLLSRDQTAVNDSFSPMKSQPSGQPKLGAWGKDNDKESQFRGFKPNQAQGQIRRGRYRR